MFWACFRLLAACPQPIRAARQYRPLGLPAIFGLIFGEKCLHSNWLRAADWQASGRVPSPPVEPLYVLGLFRAACCTPAARLSWRPISAYWAGCHFRSHFWAKVIGPQGTQSFYLASFWLRPITPCRATLCSGLVLGRLLCFRGPFELAANIGL